MPDYDRFRIGGTFFPLGTTDSLLKTADPAVYYALDFFKSVITTYCDDAFRAWAAVAGLSDLTAAGSVVRAVAPLDIGPDLQNSQLWSKLPVLALYRDRARYNQKSVARYEQTDRWILDYILPPLSAGQLEVVIPILTAIDKVVLDRSVLGHDPYYADDLKVFGSDGCASGVSSIKLVERARPLITTRDGAVQTVFRMTTLGFDVVETKIWTSEGLEQLAGVDAGISVAPNDGSDPVPFTDVTVTVENDDSDD